MSEKQNVNGFNLYEVRTSIPLLLVLAMLFGFFQNCSSTWTQDRDFDDQKRANGVNPVVLSTSSANITRLEGTPLNLSVPSNLFSDLGLTYCPTAKYDWSFVSGSSNPVSLASVKQPSLQIASLSLADEGSYFVDVECKGQQYNLGPVNLDVVPKLRVDSSNVTNQTVNQGSPANLSAVFSGPNPISYQWYFLPENGKKVALAGQDSQTFNIASAQISDQGSYELKATSAEGGIGQSATAGPGKLTVIPISSVSGSVSGDSQVVSGEPINLNSQVSGASNPSYQWYFNSQPVAGETNSNMEIPSSELSDSGTYSLIVNELGTDYQIGSVDVVVLCAVGEVAFNYQCLPSSKICQVINGNGIQFIKDDGEYGKCTITSCDPGFTNLNNTCVPAQGSCTIKNGTGLATYDSQGSVGLCVVQTCNTGYININNECVPKVCSVQNGVGTIMTDANNNPKCEVAYCNTDFVKFENKCVPRIQTCSIANGSGTRVFDGNGPGPCNVSSCSTGYVNINNTCVSRDCPVQNGQGVLALSPGGSVSCKAVSCSPGYFLYNNQCSSQSCTVSNGSGFWDLVNGQRICKVTACSPGFANLNNECVQTTCSISNGEGNIGIDVNGIKYCQPVSCDKGYLISDKVCVPGVKNCSIKNGKGLVNDAGQCVISTCNAGYTPYNNTCVAEVQSCTVPNGVGMQTFTTSGPGECVVQSCNKNYIQQGNTCVSKRRACTIANGEGYQMAFSNGWGRCELASCDAGFGATITDQCLPEKRMCYIGSGQGYQYLTPYGYTACQLDSCPEGFSLLNGYCQMTEKLMCEPTEPRGNAYKGKVFGRLYSMKNMKSTASIHNSNKPSNRLNGEVFFDNIDFTTSSEHNYLVHADGKRVQHPDGEFLKDWFGLELFSELIPPDGDTDGRYILGLSADFGSALDCKVDGSWNMYVDSSNSGSCGVVRPASSAISFSKKKPLPIRIRYLQKSGSGRCLKLYYKREGSSKPFKIIPEKYMRLPDGTVNRCPKKSTPDKNPNTWIILKGIGYSSTKYCSKGSESMTMYKASTKECLKVSNTCEKEFAWSKGFGKDIYNYCY